MMIGGGPTEFTCQVFLNDDDVLGTLLNDPEITGHTITIRRPYSIDVPSNQIVDKDTVKRAAMVFVESGRLDDGLCWS
jgi:hypothetical protein